MVGKIFGACFFGQADVAEMDGEQTEVCEQAVDTPSVVLGQMLNDYEIILDSGNGVVKEDELEGLEVKLTNLDELLKGWG